MGLASEAIRMRHPKALALGRFKTEGYDDEGLIEVAYRLSSWITRQKQEQ